MSETNFQLAPTIDIDTSIEDDDARLEHIQKVRMQVAQQQFSDADPKAVKVGLEALKHVGDTIIAKKRIAVEDKQNDNQAIIIETLSRLQNNFGNVNPFSRSDDQAKETDIAGPRGRPEKYADIDHIPKTVFTVGDQGLSAKNFIREYEEANPISDDEGED